MKKRNKNQKMKKSSRKIWLFSLSVPLAETSPPHFIHSKPKKQRKHAFFASFCISGKKKGDCYASRRFMGDEK